MDTMHRKRDLRVNIDIHDSGFSARSCGSSFSDQSVYTPTSGRSSPLYADSTSFEPCFSQTQGLPYGFSPASSVASQELQGICGLSWDFSSASSSFMDHSPSTPSRCNNNGNGQLMVPDNSYLQQFTPTSSDHMNFDDIVYNDQFSPAPFVTPSRTFYVPPSHSPEEMGPWPMLESSPLSYRQRQGPRLTYKREQNPPMFNFREQVGLSPVHQKSAALQQVASLQRVHREPRMRSRQLPKNEKRESVVPPRKGMIPCVETTIFKKDRIPCQWDGCSAAFSRREHLTRHVRNKHLKIIEAVCKCCEDQNIHKSFDRHDNYLTHLALHVTGQGRVKFHPDAGRLHAEELAKVKRRAPSQRHLQKKLARQSVSGESTSRSKRSTLVKDDDDWPTDEDCWVKTESD